ncbi:hypothetical protein SAMN04489712_112151 [Thermomonospora echinospora]|uniref:Uncharacterized protein n=1 Tax=Thermomonospora echinospora TaxID=1992 RepID=A0A1H6D116_9ACTN|nr:hypothetical protein [Thermomonospora echinospora]SEG78992.1 hypothetical protein SAMN04489712_112151 [Thermomonospora echinospora]
MSRSTQPPAPMTDGEAVSSTDPRRAALQALAGLLRGRGLAVTVESWHLTATDHDSGRSVEVWAQHRSADQDRLWFCWAGGAPIVEAANLMDAALYVGTELCRES